MRAFLLLSCFVIAGVAAYYGEPFVRHNMDAIVILTTVFTVFAGFLVAIITILGDPSLIPPGSWRTAEARRENIESGLITHVWLFVAYLIAVGLLFVGVVVGDAPDTMVPEMVKVWIGRAYLFLGAASFLCTFGLAKSMLSFQISRIDAEIRRRRKNEGIKDND